ncbi:unnamed protein product [Lymnaea stagnalis]|uniref:3CxxC-type domain-containing protein n=1 Tax=Lymnaea stagnalis TaxID=6523 RepID=A0AAV2HI68_LYMST
MFGNRNNLQRMYGYFRCTQCSKVWESSHVYCPRGSTTASYGQECKDCRVMCLPYRVGRIKCSLCGEIECRCLRSDRHVDPNKSHRADLCAKCRAGNLCT